MAIDKRDAHTLARAVETRDMPSVGQLVTVGKAMELDAGSLVNVVGESFNERKIEILEGAQRGRSGWVPFEWLKVPRQKKLG
jgi:hypothetical protein